MIAVGRQMMVSLPSVGDMGPSGLFLTLVSLRRVHASTSRDDAD